MLIALFGGDGRAMCTHAAVLLARAASLVGTPTTLVRVVDTHASRLPRPAKVTDALRVVELCGDGPPLFESLKREAAAVPDHHLVVLDLPPAWLVAGPLDLAGHARVVAVGPSALECTIAASALSGIVDASPTWLLSCGATSVKAFERAMRAAMAAACLPDTATRMIGCGLPGPARSDVTSPETDDVSVREALRVLDTVAPGSAGSPMSAAEAPVPLAMAGQDRRSPQDRLRDLADALDAAEGGEYPSADELAVAPVLEDWELGMRPVAALVGRVTGHCDHQAGRRVRTSEVYVSDRRTWARTYSRLYRLGRPAGQRPSLQ